MKTISVIVPVYNTRDDLEKCLYSICNQTYKELEIICIDDGSSDGSERIADQFAQMDSRIKIVHQQNAGESNARNVGLKLAEGEYIAFCDCDDWLDEDMYQIMIEAAEKDNLDIVAAGWYKEEGGISEQVKNHLSVEEEVFDQTQLLKYLYMRDSYRGFAYMWNKLYRRECIYDNRGKIILFDEQLKLGGDVLYLAEIALNANRVKYIDRAFYHYNQRSNSGCHTRNVEKLKDWLRAYEIVIKRFEEKAVEKEIIDYVKRFLAYHSSNAAEIAIEQGQIAAAQQFQKVMEKYREEYVRLNQNYPERLQRYFNLLSYGNGENNQ